MFSCPPRPVEGLRSFDDVVSSLVSYTQRMRRTSRSISDHVWSGGCDTSRRCTILRTPMTRTRRREGRAATQSRSLSFYINPRSHSRSLKGADVMLNRANLRAERLCGAVVVVDKDSSAGMRRSRSTCSRWAVLALRQRRTWKSDAGCIEVCCGPHECTRDCLVHMSIIVLSLLNWCLRNPKYSVLLSSNAHIVGRLIYTSTVI